MTTQSSTVVEENGAYEVVVDAIITDVVNDDPKLEVNFSAAPQHPDNSLNQAGGEDMDLFLENMVPKPQILAPVPHQHGDSLNQAAGEDMDISLENMVPTTHILAPVPQHHDDSLNQAGGEDIDLVLENMAPTAQILALVPHQHQHVDALNQVGGEDMDTALENMAPTLPSFRQEQEDHNMNQAVMETAPPIVLSPKNLAVASSLALFPAPPSLNPMDTPASPVDSFAGSLASSPVASYPASRAASPEINLAGGGFMITDLNPVLMAFTSQILVSVPQGQERVTFADSDEISEVGRTVRRPRWRRHRSDQQEESDKAEMDHNMNQAMMETAPPIASSPMNQAVTSSLALFSASPAFPMDFPASPVDYFAASLVSSPVASYQASRAASPDINQAGGEFMGTALDPAVMAFTSLMLAPAPHQHEDDMNQAGWEVMDTTVDPVGIAATTEILAPVPHEQEDDINQAASEVMVPIWFLWQQRQTWLQFLTSRGTTT